MKQLLIMTSLLMATSSFADMQSDFQSGQSFAKSKVAGVVQTAKTMNPQSIPGFKTSHPSEEQYKNNNIDNAAKQQVNNNLAGRFVNQSYQTREHEKINKNDALVTHADAIVKQGTQTEQHNGYCAGGDCTDTHYQPSPDFKKAISSLSAAGAASHDLGGGYSIFTGQHLSCRIYWLGYDNCCQDNGWGQDIGLAGCNSEEHQLGKKKEAQVCHQVGDKYCSKWFHFIFGKTCVRHNKGYCCFHSKLARIVQEAGHAQLGISWGTAEHPSCHGFTPDQLQRIDFSRINFNQYGFYDDINKKIHSPNVPVTQGHIRNQVQQDINRGKPN